MKPSRSDEVLKPEEQRQAEAVVRQYYDARTPKRAPKPARSDPGNLDQVGNSHEPVVIPEEQRFRQLISESQKLPIDTDPLLFDEYCETEYYKDLTSVVSGEHHTTGTGFIAMESYSGRQLPSVECQTQAAQLRRPSSRSNPATNDWEPAMEMAFLPSTKPSRSDP